MFRNCTGGVRCKECICTTLGPGALSSPSSQETVLAEGPHEAKSAKENSGEPAMPICAHLNLQRRAQESLPCPSMVPTYTCTPTHHFRLYPFANLFTLFFFFWILYSSTPNIYPTALAHGTVTGSHVHKTWYHSPGCSDWKNKGKLAPSSVPISGFHDFFPTLKPQHTHTDWSMVCPVIAMPSLKTQGLSGLAGS